MIRRPRAEDLEGLAALEAVRETGVALSEATRPLRTNAGETMRGVWWSLVIPAAAVPAMWLVSQRWPGTIDSVGGYYLLIGVWAFALWKLWLGPRQQAEVDARIAAMDGLEETAAMRAALEARWTDRGPQP